MILLIVEKSIVKKTPQAVLELTTLPTLPLLYWVSYQSLTQYIQYYIKAEYNYRIYSLYLIISLLSPQTLVGIVHPTRESLLWPLNQLDREVGISFDSDFNFALSTLLFKGISENDNLYSSSSKSTHTHFYFSQICSLFINLFLIFCSGFSHPLSTVRTRTQELLTTLFFLHSPQDRSVIIVL